MTQLAQKLISCNYKGCNSTFSHIGYLRRHERGHVNKNVYKCLHIGCTATFSYASSLNNHARMHVRIYMGKPYKCSYDFCEYSFSKPSYLQRHEWVHSGKKPYVCKHLGCTASFAHPSSLKKHIIKNHNTEILHEICDSTLSYDFLNIFGNIHENNFNNFIDNI